MQTVNRRENRLQNLQHEVNLSDKPAREEVTCPRQANLGKYVHERADGEATVVAQHLAKLKKARDFLHAEKRNAPSPNLSRGLGLETNRHHLVLHLQGMGGHTEIFQRLQLHPPNTPTITP